MNGFTFQYGQYMNGFAFIFCSEGSVDSSRTSTSDPLPGTTDILVHVCFRGNWIISALHFLLLIWWFNYTNFSNLQIHWLPVFGLILWWHHSQTEIWPGLGASCTIFAIYFHFDCFAVNKFDRDTATPLTHKIPHLLSTVNYLSNKTNYFIFSMY